MLTKLSRSFASLMGVEFSPVSHAERLISALGGFLGILGVIWISHYFVSTEGAALIVASMGASAVLLFAIPHGPLSQPWPLVGGNVISAIIGVTCAKFFPGSFVTAAAASALAIAAMHYLRCLHPPGGATALTAVLGGPGIHTLGYQYVLTPVLLNVSILLGVAVLVNALFPWRRYPAPLARAKHPQTRPSATLESQESRFGHGDLAYALREMDSFIDISEEDLERIYQLATRHADQAPGMEPGEIMLGRFYSNGRYGDGWGVRQVVDMSGPTDAPQGTVIYRIVAGKAPRRQAASSRGDFAQWARYEVVFEDGAWRRAGGPHASAR